MFHADASPAAVAIRQCEERATKLTHLDVMETAKRAFVPRVDIVKKLNDWNDMEVITLKAAGVLHVYRVLSELPQTNAEIDTLAKEVFAQLEEREKKDLKRTDQMLSLITGSACFSRSLAEHFGDTITGGKKDCGHCTWCLTNRPVPLVKPPPKPFDIVPFNKILEVVPDRDDARFLAKIAFGISSPKITAAKLGGQNPLFGSMDDHPFEVSVLMRSVRTTGLIRIRIYLFASPLFVTRSLKVYCYSLLRRHLLPRRHLLKGPRRKRVPPRPHLIGRVLGADLERWINQSCADNTIFCRIFTLWSGQAFWDPKDLVRYMDTHITCNNWTRTH